MDENNPPRKTRWEWLKPSHSDPHLVQERGRRAASHDPSSPSPSGNKSIGRPSGSVRKLFGKMTKRLARSARQSPNPEHTAASFSPQDIPPIQSIKDLTTSALELNPEQSFNTGLLEGSSTANEVEYPDPKVVKEGIANANKGVAVISQVPKFVQDTASAVNDIPRSTKLPMRSQISIPTQRRH
ncbi:hypothetical protein BDR04DRAFT_1107900 [Suillus decipiens]|nr:hypothetical protein BDR04DRAFT_1107900 [Suillus decipiens]